MERIYTLIEKLYQQKAAAAPPSHLLFTVQLLHNELTQLQNTTAKAGTAKVAVMLPVNLNFSAESLRVPFTEAKTEKEVFVLDGVEENRVAEEPVVAISAPVAPARELPLNKPAREQVVQEALPVRDEPRPQYSAQELFSTAFETAVEAPTLPHTPRVELHERIAEKKESLNDRLKEDRTELAHLLKESPIRDLRKGIGINDRFVFVKELFRGDEAMYERSVKTINNFNIYSEAEYWIARELKHKLGWSDSHPSVRLFYSLVRRRFS